MILWMKCNRCSTGCRSGNKPDASHNRHNWTINRKECNRPAMTGAILVYNTAWQIAASKSRYLPVDHRCIMFVIRPLLCAVIAVLISSGVTVAQSDFFLSFQNLNQGASNSNPVESFSPGDSGTLYLYWTTNGPADSDIDTGAFVDLQTTQSGVIQFTSAQTFNFNITLLGSTVGPRWDVFGGTAAVSDDAVDGLSAFVIFSGLGMKEDHNGSTGLVDQGYDSGADAFLFGKIDFVVLADPVADSVNITMATGSGGIFNSGTAVNATFGSATIEIGTGVLLGDVNLDGVVDMDDVNPFVQVIINGPYQEEADVNQDGAVDLRDVMPFIKLL